MESHEYPHLGLTFHLALFTNLSNAAALRDRLIHTSTLPATPEGDAARTAVNFAFIDASMVTSRLALLTACYQACISEREGSLRTRTVHSEVLWCLSPGSNITDSLKRFGLSPNTKSLMVVHICPTLARQPLSDDVNSPDNVELRMRSAVHGQLVSVDGVAQVTDWAAIRKVYKLGADLWLQSVQKSTVSQAEKEHLSQHVVDETVISLVAMKSVAA